jgi:hypothetical protein
MYAKMQQAKREMQIQYAQYNKTHVYKDGSSIWDLNDPTHKKAVLQEVLIM